MLEFWKIASFFDSSSSNDKKQKLMLFKKTLWAEGENAGILS